MVYDRIILCLEGTVDETSLVNETMRIVSALNASLTVFHVNDPNAGKPHLMMDSLPRITRKDLLSMFENAGYGEAVSNITFDVIDDQAYSETIAMMSEHADLMIMGHHKHSRLVGALINSTDEQVADRAECPVLLVPLT